MVVDAYFVVGRGGGQGLRLIPDDREDLPFAGDPFQLLAAMNGELEDYEYPAEKVREALEELPKIAV